jgi:hypothetical protein
MVLELFIVWQKLRQYNSQYFRHWCVFIIERMTRDVLVNHAIMGGVNAKIYAKLLISDSCFFVCLKSGKNKSLKKLRIVPLLLQH